MKTILIMLCFAASAFGQLKTSDYFEGTITHDLTAAATRAKQAGKPVWLVITDPLANGDKQHLALKYFMENAETKKLVKAGFIVCVAAKNHPTVKKYIEAGEVDRPLLVVLMPDGTVVEKLVMNHNGQDGLKHTKGIIEKCNTIQAKP